MLLENSFSDYALHLAFSTYPLGSKDEYLKSIEKIYSEHKKNFEKLTGNTVPDYLYEPIKYHIFGLYDICFISLFDSYKFAQKVFTSNIDTNKSISYQIQAGGELKFLDNQSLEEKFKKLKNSDLTENNYFLQSNLKLNNALLIGNGKEFLEAVVEKINKKLGDNSLHFIINSYNWSEINLVLFDNDFASLSKKFEELRVLVASELEGYENLIEKSLYKKFEFEYEKIKKSHCFIDTHSYFGIKAEYLNSIGIDKLDQIDIELDTQIEFQLKPGYYKDFKDAVDKINDNYSGKIFDINKINFKTGKTDLICNEVISANFKNNIILYIELHKEYSLLAKCIRKVKTITRFPSTHESHNYLGVSNFSDKLSKYKFDQKSLEEIEIWIRSLSLSRQIRMKIMKVFHNYCNSIIDPILFIYYIDFKRFLDGFKEEISNDFNFLRENIKNKKYNEVKSVAYIEKKYSKFLNAFEEAYLDRTLNNYSYEDINDFNIDFNSSMTATISTWDTAIKSLSQSFNVDSNGLLVRINEINTESNGISVNYNVHHLIDPALIFVTIGKEILNSEIYNPKLKIEIKEISNTFKQIIFNELQKRGLSKFEVFDCDYLIIDPIVFLYTFNGNFELFEYWTWVYTLQNSSQYATLGSINEKKFIHILIRLVYVNKFFNIDNNISCPIPELQHFYEKYIGVVLLIVNKLLEPKFKYKFHEIICSLRNEGIQVSSRSSNSIHEIELIYRNIRNSLDILNLTNVEVDFLKCKFTKYKSYINRIEKFCNYEVSIENEDFKDLRFIYLEILNLLYTKIFKEDDPYIKNSMKGYFEKIVNESFFGAKFNILSYITLNRLKNQNNSEIHLLRRYYQTGEPIPEFIKVKKREKVFVDPNGDFFIPSSEQMKEKMNFNHNVFYSLWDLVMKEKIQLFLK